MKNGGRKNGRISSKKSVGPSNSALSMWLTILETLELKGLNKERIYAEEKPNQTTFTSSGCFLPKNSTTTPLVAGNENCRLGRSDVTRVPLNWFPSFVSLCVLADRIKLRKVNSADPTWEVGRRRSLIPSPSRSRSQRKYIVYFQCHPISLNTTVHYMTVTILFFKN